MKSSSNKSVTLTSYAWMGFLLMIAGVVILILGLVPDAPFVVEYEKFKMTTPQTGVVLVFTGAFVGYLATKSTAEGATTYSSNQIRGVKFKRKMFTISIIVGIIALITFFVFRYLNF